MNETPQRTESVSICFPHAAGTGGASAPETALSKLRRIAILAAHVLAIGIAGCGGSNNEETAAAQGDSAPVPVPAPAPAPSAPAPAPAPAPTSSSYSVSLSWAEPQQNTDGSSLTDVAGYQISYGTNSANLDRQLNLSNPNASSTTVTGLAAGTYYFSIKTLNSSGVASAASGVVSQTVP